MDEYTRFVAVLVPLAESRFKSDAAQKKSRGIYQQTPPWWATWNGTATEQCMAFLADFASKARLHTGRPIPDAWQTQQWDAPDPRLDMAGFVASRETKNYETVLPFVADIIRTGRLPANLP